MKTRRQETLAALARLRQYGDPGPLKKDPAGWISTVLMLVTFGMLSGTMQSAVTFLLWVPVLLSGPWMLRQIIRLWGKWDSGFPSPLRTLTLIIVATLVAYGLVIAGLYAGHFVTRSIRYSGSNKTIVGRIAF